MAVNEQSDEHGPILTDAQRAVLRRVDEQLRGPRRPSLPTTVRVEAGDWTTVEAYVERIVAEQCQRDYVLDGSPEAVAIVREARGLPPITSPERTEP